MKSIALSCLLLSTLVVSADPPRAPKLNDYSRLWTDSPFTAKPPPPDAPEAVNPLDDYALSGISKLKSGYYAILINKKHPKDPSKRVVISPDSQSGFKIVSVKWSEGSWKDTKVTVKRGIFSRELGFDDELVKVTPQAKAPQNQRKPNASPIPGMTKQGDNNQPPRRAPRPRVVVPPNQNKSNNNNRNQNRRGRSGR